MKRLLTLPLLLLASCGIVAPARDTAQWQTSTHDVSVTWRATTPGGLGRIEAGNVLGHATWVLVGTNCVVDMDLAQSRARLVRTSAPTMPTSARATPKPTPTFTSRPAGTRSGRWVVSRPPSAVAPRTARGKAADRVSRPVRK